MALRGFYNDNLSLPGRSSSGPETGAAIAHILHKGGAVRHIYDSLEGITPVSSMEGRPGVEVAGVVATAVSETLSGDPDQHPKAYSAASSFIQRYAATQGLQ